MIRRFFTIAAVAGIAALSLTPHAAHAGGYTVAAAECASTGAVITWKHIDEARLQERSGVKRSAEILSVTVEATGQVLSTTSTGTFQWQTESFNVIGDVAFLVRFRDTTDAPGPIPQGGTVPSRIVSVVETPAPGHRVSFTCAAPPTTTTLPPTTAAVPTTTIAATAPVVPAPVTTVAAPTTAPLAPRPAALPVTGTENSLMMLGGAFLLLAGSTMTLSTQLRKRS